MAFSEETKAAAFRRAGGRCECQRSRHAHRMPCGKLLTRGTARFHHITAQGVGGADSLSNCEVLCVICHLKTPSYGRR
jgi:5-methylcytosine-specific restriction endonuclease McrA